MVTAQVQFEPNGTLHAYTLLSEPDIGMRVLCPHPDRDSHGGEQIAGTVVGIGGDSDDSTPAVIRPLAPGEIL